MSISSLVARNRVCMGYVFDYAVVIVCIAGFSALDLADPHEQQFSLADVHLQHPYATRERVPALWAALVAILAPAVVMALWCGILEGRVLRTRQLSGRTRVWEINVAVLGLLLSVGLALVTTNIFKNTVGRPRPDLIDRCRPVQDAASMTTPFGLSNVTICRQTDRAVMRDGYKSFPSGHSSTAFSGLGYLAIWLAGKLHTLDGAGHVWKVALISVPVMAATLIAASRIMDARHHPFDVLFGSALGAVAAWISYRQYYPAIRSGGVPHSRETDGRRTHGVSYRPTGTPLHEEEYRLTDYRTSGTHRRGGEEEGEEAESASQRDVSADERVCTPAVLGSKRTATSSQHINQ